MRTLVTRVAAVPVVLGAVWGIGQALACRRSVGDECSNELELASYLGGASWTSTAASFRSVSVRARVGGVAIRAREPTGDGHRVSGWATT